MRFRRARHVYTTAEATAGIAAAFLKMEKGIILRKINLHGPNKWLEGQIELVAEKDVNTGFTLALKHREIQCADKDISWEGRIPLVEPMYIRGLIRAGAAADEISLTVGYEYPPEQPDIRTWRRIVDP